MCLLRGRKDIRDFSAWKGETLVAKSPLDGARESVLLPGYVFSSNIRIKKGEALDIVGVVKRTAGDERFPSVSRVAVDGWIRNIVKTEPDALQEIKEACEKLAKAGVISRALLPLYNLHSRNTSRCPILFFYTLNPQGEACNGVTSSCR